MNEQNELRGFLDQAWQCLRHGVTNQDVGARHPILATVSPNGRPEARIVVLRAADEAQATVEIHTDPASAKIRSLKANSFGEVLIWEPEQRLQIRLAVSVQILTGPAVATRWEKVPEPSRSAYGTTPPPGTAIESAFAYEKPGLRSGFAALLCRIERIDLVHLGDRHRRAAYLAEEGWLGTWCAP